jgi:hypothetical protein
MDLKRIFDIDNKEANLPVAFATNAMYVLARNDIPAGDIIQEKLLPLIKQKKEYLHAEGIAHMAYALSKEQIWDKEAWEIIGSQVPSKQFDYVLVKNDRWSLSRFCLHSGSEHWF